jgi:hypothetical protein
MGMDEPVRRRPGRPPGPHKRPEEKFEGITVRFPPEMMAELRALPHGARAEMVRRAVQRALLAHRAGLEP